MLTFRRNLAESCHLERKHGSNENPIHFDQLRLLDSSCNGIVAIDASGIVVYFNKTAGRSIQPMK